MTNQTKGAFMHDGTSGRYTGGAPSCLLGFGEHCGDAVKACGLGLVLA